MKIGEVYVKIDGEKDVEVDEDRNMSVHST